MRALLQHYLELNDMTQRELASRLGCTTAFINNIVNFKNTDIKISLLKKLADTTRIPMEKLANDLLSCKKPSEIEDNKDGSRTLRVKRGRTGKGKRSSVR
jgi:transcriptional regulator with XRE-family HTH domain